MKKEEQKATYDIKELRAQVTKLRELALNMRFSKAYSKVPKPNIVRATRRGIAKLLTEINKRRREGKN